MKIRICELRKLICEALESYDAYMLNDKQGIYIIICDKSGNIIAGICGDFRTVKTETFDTESVFEILEAFSTNPRAAIAVFQTALNHFDGLKPSSIISPAAQAVVKRWYDKHKNDGSVVPLRKSDYNPNYIDSIYYVPRSGLPFAMSLKTPESDEFADQLLHDFQFGFDEAYDNHNLTKQHDLNRMLKNKNIHDIMLRLKQKTSDNQTFAIKHEKELRVLITNADMLEVDRRTYINDLDNLIDMT